MGGLQRGICLSGDVACRCQSRGNSLPLARSQGTLGERFVVANAADGDRRLHAV